jgi:hypothetical protein
MSKPVPLFQRTDFDPETINVLAPAYEKACKSLHDKGQLPLVQESIAARIIAAARAGERDPGRLCEIALVALGTKAVFE